MNRRRLVYASRTVLIMLLVAALVVLGLGLAAVVAALEAVGRGESLLDPAVTGKVLERMRRIAASDEPDELGSLTQQERKILALVAEARPTRRSRRRCSSRTRP